jgi:NADH-quinone oxidoreductase subunit A
MEHSHYFFGWGATLVFMTLGVIFLLTPLVVLGVFRPSKPNANKSLTYECGEEAIGDSWIRFNPRFYVIALVFVLFDIEVLFMYPWAVVFGKVHRGQLAGLDPALTLKFVFAEMMVFLGILVVGFAYLWRYGFLEWVKSVRVGS